MFAARSLSLVLMGMAVLTPSAGATDLPSGFVDELVLDAGASAATFQFSPDGRLFFGQRILGKLHVADFDAGTGQWIASPTPFASFEIPKNAAGIPEKHRSSGLRDIAFDPAFATNGLLYVFYMRDNPRHNRVVRIQRDPANPDQMLAGSETLLLDLPFNGNESSGSHNGGALEIGPDGRLYVTTGDGWNGGDPVQSLSTWTGKVLRLNLDGSIPTDNPFFSTAVGDHRAIFALGCRNPFSMSRDPMSGTLYLNETTGSRKTEVWELTAGANFNHQGYGGIGTSVEPFADASTGGHLNTGGAWYATGYFDVAAPMLFPPEYRGYFVAQWGTNGGSSGNIVRIPSTTLTTPQDFATSVSGIAGGESIRPTLTRFGPDGQLYYLLTTYETESGEIRRIRWSGTASVETPTITPNGGIFELPVQVSLSTTTVGAGIHYTTDGIDPDQNDPLYTAAFTMLSSGTVKARAYHPSLLPSAVAAAAFEIGNPANIPPVALAGPDVTLPVGTLVTLNGSASYDPDGSDELLSDTWIQISGPLIPDFDGADFVSFFTPQQVGDYAFRLFVSDQEDVSTDDAVIHVVACLDEVLDGLTARWSFEEAAGALALDSSPGAVNGDVLGAVWTTESATLDHALRFDGVDDAVEITRDLSPSGSAVTFSAWFKADDFDVHDARILSKATGSTDAEHLFMVSTIEAGTNVRLRFRLRTGGVTTTLIASSGDLQAGAWTHVTAWYDGLEMRLYKDGVLVGSAAKNGLLDTDPVVRVAIGNQPAGVSGGGRPFDGIIDDVRIYQRALDQSEILTLASATIGSVPSVCACQEGLGFQGPGDAYLSLCGDLATGGTATLRVSGLTPGQPAVLFVGTGSNPSSVLGGTLVPNPVLFVVPISVAVDDGGFVALTVRGGGGPLTLYLQVLGITPALKPHGVTFSNAVKADWLP